MPEIEEKEVSDFSELPALVAEQKPFFIRGLVADWPLVEAGKVSASAARAYLLNHASERQFTFSSAPANRQGRLFYDAKMKLNFSEQKALLADIFERFENAAEELTYLSSVETDKYFDGISQTHNLEIDSKQIRQSLWIGSHSVVPVHNDAPDNFACVLVGRRRFTLFPPEQLENLYIGPLDFTPAGRSVSFVDINNPDFKRFPKYAEAQAQALTIELAPGDILHIPSMWWHSVEALDTFNVMMNFWWRREGKEFLGDPEAALIHAIMTLRDLPDDKRRVWETLFSHYVFNHVASHIEHIPEVGQGIMAPLTPETASRIKSYLLHRLNG